MSNDVVSETAAWYARIAAARAAGIELEELSQKLRAVVSRNYFGNGCEEGAELFTQLRPLLDNASATLRVNAQTAFQLSQSATTASQELTNADSSGTKQFPR